MNLISLTGAFIITLALLSYGIGSISVQRFKTVTSGVLIFLSLGVFLDLVAVTLMIMGMEADGTAFTLHGILGYSATLTMLIDLFLIWRTYLKNGMQSKISKPLVIYSKFAYSWWVIAYITGSLLVLWAK